jgi:transcriptional regulator with XRE-family HTH domain
MLQTDPGSTVPRRQLGRYLRQLREDARITVKRASEELEWSAPKIWRIEGGATSMRALDVEAMCRLYGASPDQTQILMGLARETKSKGWWHSYNDAIPAYFELYVGLESSAERLRQYEPELIPGFEPRRPNNSAISHGSRHCPTCPSGYFRTRRGSTRHRWRAVHSSSLTSPGARLQEPHRPGSDVHACRMGSLHGWREERRVRRLTDGCRPSTARWATGRRRRPR